MGFSSCGLLCDALSTSEYMTSKGRIAVEGGNRDPAELLSWHLPARIEDSTIYMAGYAVSWPSNRTSKTESATAT
jgi:hypothetical protein